MKKTTLLLLIGLLFAGPALADAVDEGLPAGADDALKAHTRTMLQVGVNADEGLNMTRAMLQNRYQNQQIIQAQKSVMAAVRQGMPAAPVINKAHEGIAKNVPADGVVQAMAQVQNRYAKAYQMASELNLNGRGRQQLGNVMAEAMTAGMSVDAGQRIMQQLGAKTQARNNSEANELAVQTAMTTREMSRRGVDADTTADVVCLALENQFQAREMAQLRQQFRTQAHQQAPQEWAQQMAQQFTHSLQQGQNDASQGTGSGAGNSTGGTSGGAGTPGGTGGTPGGAGTSGDGGTSGAGGSSGGSGGSGDGAGGGSGSGGGGK